MSFQIEWLPAAKMLLGMRDRFTRDEILEQFKSHPRQNAVDLHGGVWATPVADNRYAVVWQENQQDPNTVTILAIVAAQLKKFEDAVALRQKLGKVASVESNGAITQF